MQSWLLALTVTCSDAFNFADRKANQLNDPTNHWQLHETFNVLLLLKYPSIYAIPKFLLFLIQKTSMLLLYPKESDSKTL